MSTSAPVAQESAVPDAMVIDRQILQQARANAAASQRNLITELEALTGQEQRQLAQALAALFDLQVMETVDMLHCEPAFDLLPLSRSIQRHCILLRAPNGTLLGVIADPFDLDLQTWLNSISKTTLQYRLAIQSDIAAYLSKQEENTRATETNIGAKEEGKRDGKTAAVLSFASVSEAASPAVKLVNSTLYDALKSGASDIHLESTASGLVVKYRVDGVLDHATSVNGIEIAEHVISRIKVLAELDISERRIPQDGSFRVETSGREIDLRVSIMPSIHGEDAVIRVLDKRAMIEAYGSLTLEALGFDAPSLVILRGLAEEPYGMLLVTGPTGSGKTTTLYAALSRLNASTTNILTVEDPIEYELPGIGQTQVNARIEMTFAKALRAILRQDPDVIMIGEIRDLETAQIAVQASLTGHLVLATLHTNDSAAAVTRLLDMGIEPFLLSSSLLGVLAQRLVRKLCQHCKREEAGEWHPVGCEKCANTGYQGRLGVYELLTTTDQIRAQIHQSASEADIRTTAKTDGMLSMREDGERWISQGVTSREELLRVTKE